MTLLSSSTVEVESVRWRDPDGLKDLTVAVVGMARTGRACARALLSRGASVLAFDRDPIVHDPELRELLELGMIAHDAGYFGGIEAADLMIPSPGVPASSPVLTAAVDRGTAVWSEIEVAYRLSKAPIIAFTGTNGKSTTTALCGSMLAMSGRQARIGGNLAPGIPLVTLAEQSREEQVIVAEISSFQLEWVVGFRPRVGAILNLSPDHKDRHPTLDQYAATKSRLVQQQGWTDAAIFGDPFAEAYPHLLKGDGRHLRFSVQHPVDYGAFLDGERMRIVGRGDAVDGSLPDLILSLKGFTLPGVHNRENAMAAALAALELGATPESIERALRSFDPLPHRIQTVRNEGGVRWINNSMCTNAAAAVASLSAVEGDLVVITGGRSKGLDMGPYATALAKRARWTVLMGESTEEMADLLRHAGSSAFESGSSLEDAVARAAARAIPPTSVMLLPGFSSFDMFRDFEDRGRRFEDAVRDLYPDVAVARR